MQLLERPQVVVLRTIQALDNIRTLSITSNLHGLHT
jgi:hypothetical protein